MSRARSNSAGLAFAAVLVISIFGRASGAPDDTGPRITGTERRPVSPPCDPGGPGWSRTYGQDNRGDGRLYQGASATLQDSAGAYQAAVRQAQERLIGSIRLNVQQELYSYLEQWPRSPDRRSNKAFADSALLQIDLVVSSTVSVWKSADCPQADAKGNVWHQAFVVVRTELGDVVRSIWSIVETRLVMPERADGESNSDVFEQEVMKALGVSVRMPGNNPESVRIAEQKRLENERRAAELRREVERSLAAEDRLVQREAGPVPVTPGIDVTGSATPVRAGDGPPKAEALIQKMIDATGGKGAYDKLQSQFTRGKLTITRAKVELTHTVWSQRPNKSYSLLESKALGKMESVCDGATVWETSQMTGPSLKNGPERALQLREADFDHWPNWTKYYKSATAVGADIVAGKTAWKVEMVPIEGPPETMWLDQTTGLLLKTSTKLTGEMGAVPVEIFIEDYLDACGIKIPSRTRMVAMGGMQEVVTSIDSVACNPVVPKDRFDMPAEIKALFDKLNNPAAPAETVTPIGKNPTGSTPAEKAPVEKTPADNGGGKN